MYPNLPDIIHRALLDDRREPTGLLHCSSHAHWPLRFTQLSMVIGETDVDFGSLITMYLGTLTHHWLERVLDSIDIGPDWVLVDTEIDLTPLLPEGWTGTADYLFFHRPTRKYVVGDLKTAKPESLAYLNGKPKKEHTVQVSCYHAALATKCDLDPELFVCYLPKGKTAKQENVLPVVVTEKAIPADEVWANLSFIKSEVDRYRAEVKRTGEFLNQYLAPMPAPELKVSWNRAASQWDVVARPSWQETYIGAQFGEQLCPPTPSQKQGHWTRDLFYIPRKGIIQLDDSLIPRPSKYEIDRRRG